MAARVLVDRLHDRLEARGWPPLPPAAGYVLLATRSGATTQGDVASLMRASRQAASQLLDQLEDAGLVERSPDPGDSRRKTVALTDRGRRLLADVEEIYAGLEAEWAAVTGRAELEAARATLTAAVLHSYGGVLPAVGPVSSWSDTSEVGPRLDP